MIGLMYEQNKFSTYQNNMLTNENMETGLVMYASCIDIWLNIVEVVFKL